MLQSCPNCEQQLIMVNGNWRHLHTDRAVSCWTLFEVARGYTVNVDVPEEESPEIEVEDWIAAAFGNTVLSDTEDITSPLDNNTQDVEETDHSDLFALLG